MRNNSAWNQRWFVAHRGKHEKLTLEGAQTEADYALEQANKDPYNESPWRFLIAVVKEQPSLVEWCEQKAQDMTQVIENADRDREGCVNLNSARIDLLEMQDSAESLRAAIELAKAMGAKHDVIRRKYWTLRVGEMETKLERSK